MDGQLEQQADLESRPEAAVEPVTRISRVIKGRLSHLLESPRLLLVLGGTLVVALVAAVAWQTRTPTEGVAQVKRIPQRQTQQVTGKARVQTVRKAQNMARISTAGGRTDFISRDELARECIARIGGEVLDELVNRKVIEMECARLGITVNDTEVKQEVVRLCKETGMEPSQWYQILKARHNITPAQYHRNRIWPAMAMKKLVGASVSVTEQDLKTAYEHHFGARVKVRLIAYENIRRANEAWNALQKTPDDFERIAKRDSIEPNSRSLGGLIPPIRRHHEFPKLEAAAFKLRVGEISAIVQYGPPTQSRYGILKCEGHTKPEFALKDVRDYLIKMVTEQKSQASMARHLLAIKERTRVDNYLLNKTTGSARRTQQAGFARPAAAKSASGVRPANATVPRKTNRGTPPRTVPPTRR
ncbi:MAG: peptidylprolyl isomerase [Planctomycetota bacterium]|nr:peptidylprolyl isomerase [Planctomycetota bacterium]MED5401721.1 peptidylprolyl isomerase [Planctomycetota bacterium]MED5448113.1 peptidylprolyl isomerase [Planctomycetota bacterium]